MFCSLIDTNLAPIHGLCEKQMYIQWGVRCGTFDINRNKLVEIEEIRIRLNKPKKYMQKLGKDSPAKKD